MSETPKPCPQCGGQTRITEKTYRMCIECEMDLPYDHSEWWYVKELSRKDAEIVRLRGALEFIVRVKNHISSPVIQDEIIARAEEALPGGEK